jgi:valyl-tRNA synthetase
MLTSLARLVEESTGDLDAYDYTRALKRAESFFWFFCDNYLELVKSRRYGDHGHDAAASANTALLAALSSLLRLFAPYLPFVTEEVWSWWQLGSVHRASWPSSAELIDVAGGRDEAGSAALDAAALIVGEIRKKKSEEQRPLKTVARHVRVRDTRERIALVEQVRSDLTAAGLIERLDLEAGEFSVDIELAPVEPASAEATAGKASREPKP